VSERVRLIPFYPDIMMLQRMQSEADSGLAQLGMSLTKIICLFMAGAPPVPPLPATVDLQETQFWLMCLGASIVLMLLLTDFHETLVDEIGRNQGVETAEREGVSARPPQQPHRTFPPQKLQDLRAEMLVVRSERQEG
jgi:hypothetical protein